MRREIDLDQISDGKKYKSSDMVKTDCGGCQGCCDCCQGMGESVILDPYDCYSLCKGLKQSFEQLLSYAAELRMADGLILPALRMEGEREACVFLNAQGRCGIHSFRPGFCRMFPLGRLYEGEDFWYFLQIHECRKNPKTKIKVSKWLGIPDLTRYEGFVKQWHGFLKRGEKTLEHFQGDTARKQVCMFVLKTFYLEPYDSTENFYVQFEERMKKAETYFF